MVIRNLGRWMKQTEIEGLIGINVFVKLLARVAIDSFRLDSQESTKVK